MCYLIQSSMNHFFQKCSHHRISLWPYLKKKKKKKKTLSSMKKKLKNEKIGLTASHLQSVRGQALVNPIPTMILVAIEMTLSLWVKHGVVKVKEWWVRVMIVTVSLHNYRQSKGAAIEVEGVLRVLFSTATSRPCTTSTTWVLSFITTWVTLIVKSCCGTTTYYYLLLLTTTY